MSKIIVQCAALLLPPALIALPIAVAWILHLKRRMWHECMIAEMRSYFTNPQIPNSQYEHLRQLVDRIKPQDFSTAELIVLLVGEGIVLATFLLSEDIARLYLFGR